MSRIGFGEGGLIRNTSLTQVSYDEDSDDGLPAQHRWLARLLRRTGASFEDCSWPAVWVLWGHSADPHRRGVDFNICIILDQWMFGPEWPSDRHGFAHTENWQDIMLHLGPLSLTLHFWWFTPRA